MAAAPHSLEAEQSVLGAVLLSDAALPALVASGLDPADFYRPQHARIYRAMLDLHDRGEPVDTLTLEIELRRAGALDEIGGRAAIDLLASPVPAVGHVSAYVRAVRTCALDRRERALAAELASGTGNGTADRLRAQLAAVLQARTELETPASSVDTTHELGGAFVLDTPADVAAVWGHGDDVLWPQGEPLMICGPQGVGKTTLAQQLALARAGVLEPTLLGMPVTPDTRPVLYIAADRPAQAARSMRRMVDEQHRGALDRQLLVWRGPLPFNLVDDPMRLSRWVTELRVGTVVIDSLKDMAVGLSEDAVGAAVNQALQAVVAREIEVADLHHQRKGQDGHKPRKLEDVYGSTWLTAGHGSVILLWGEAGDPYVELRHLKQAAAEVGPLTIRHDHEHGRTVLPDAVDVLDLAANGVTATEAAQVIYDTSSPNRNQRERARRRLEKLADAGTVRREQPEKAGGAVTYWLACVTARDPSRDPHLQVVTQGHDLALGAVTEGVTRGHAPRNGTGHPLKGGPARDRDPHPCGVAAGGDR
jgi:replicative DNA helicase